MQMPRNRFAYGQWMAYPSKLSTREDWKGQTREFPRSEKETALSLSAGLSFFDRLAPRTTNEGVDRRSSDGQSKTRPDLPSAHAPKRGNGAPRGLNRLTQFF